MTTPASRLTKYTIHTGSVEQLTQRNIQVGRKLEEAATFPFTFLTFIVSLEAIFLSTFILISQNQDRRISEKRNHLDLQINLLSKQENTKMLMMLQAIAEKVGAEIEPDEDMTVLAQETELEKVVAQIEQHEEN